MKRRGAAASFDHGHVALLSFLVWLTPSIGQLYRYLGGAGALAASAVALLVIWVGAMSVRRDRLIDVPVQTFRYVLLGLAGLLLILFLTLYPIAKSGWLGAGSDR